MNLAGERIKQCRIKNHLTQDDVARHLGIGKQAVYKYEIGAVTNIPLENLEKMASLFNTSPEYLAGWTENPSAARPDKSLVLSSDENHLVTTYRGLTPYGKQLMMDRAAELAVLHGEKQPSSGSSKIG